MKKGNKIIIISIATIIISAVISIIFINKLKLDKPIFLMNYSEKEIYVNDERMSLDRIKLSYISNVQDNRNISKINFKEAPNSQFYIVDDMMGESEKTYGRYKVHSVEISCPYFNDADILKETVLSNATVEFDDGEKFDVDLGKIILYKDEREKFSPIQIINSSNSYDNINSQVLKNHEYVKLEKVEGNLFEENFDFNISAMAYDEEKDKYYDEEIDDINEYSIITVSSAYKESDDILENYTIYNVRPRLYFLDSNGREHIVRYTSMDNRNIKYSSKNIYKYLKARGEL